MNFSTADRGGVRRQSDRSPLAARFLRRRGYAKGVQCLLSSHLKRSVVLERSLKMPQLLYVGILRRQVGERKRNPGSNVESPARTGEMDSCLKPRCRFKPPAFNLAGCAAGMFKGEVGGLAEPVLFEPRVDFHCGPANPQGIVNVVNHQVQDHATRQGLIAEPRFVHQWSVDDALECDLLNRAQRAAAHGFPCGSMRGGKTNPHREGKS